MFYQEISIEYKRLYRTGFWIGDYHCGGRLVGKERRAGIHGRNAFYRSGIVIGVEKNRFELNRRNRAMEINAICDDIPNIHGIRYIPPPNYADVIYLPNYEEAMQVQFQ